MNNGSDLSVIFEELHPPRVSVMVKKKRVKMTR